MSDSIWKKEISFSRKPKAPEVEQPEVAAPELVAEPKQSIWKKEIGGKKKAPKETQAASELVAEPKQSIWKKEIGGKKKAPKETQAASEPVAEPKQSIWKKEIGGKKKDKSKRADDPVARLAAAAAEAVAPDFGVQVAEPVAMPTQLAEAVVAAHVPEPEPEPEPVASAYVPEPVAPAFVEALPVTAPVEVDVHPVEALPVTAPVGEPVAPPVAVPSVVPPAEPPVADVAPVAAYHVEPGPVEPWMEPQPVAVEPAEPWLSAPELPPGASVEPAVVVHPPVPAAELPPLPSAAKQPFWKKELSFSRKPKAARPAVQAPQGDVHPPVSAAELPPLASAKKQPFWKKELSFSRAAKPAASVAEPEAPRVKRGLSLPQLSLPQLSRSRGGGKHQVKRLVGLKIGGSQLAAARVANNGSAELLQVARTDLGAGIVVAGELRDPDALSEALTAFFAANKLPRKNVRLGIASNRIGVRTFDIAGIDDAKQLENAIHFRAQETLPIPLDEAVLDYHILEERVDDEGTSTKRVLLVVAYRELVDRYVAACKKAGITLSGIDLEAFALLRALSAPRSADQPGDSALVAVSIGHDRSTFAVSDGRVCEFTRVLEWGGSSLNVAIARVLDLAPSEAEGIKRLVSLSSNEVPQGVAPEQYALALDAVRKQVQAFARELVASLQFYQNQPGSLGIGEIVVTGGTANLTGIADELQRLIGVQVRVGDPLARLKMSKKTTIEGPVGSLAVAIGLGIED